ncbi:MAG: alkaline phosphatase D family protein [Pseudomonadota bacterium]
MDTRFVTRRRALQTALAGSAAAGASACTTAPKLTPFTALSAPGNEVFAHGVASGDPAATSIVLWSRINPDVLGAKATGILTCEWEVASDNEFTSIVASGIAATGAARDWTVKVIADGLTPGQRYAYRFRHRGATSATGRTMTLPEGAVDQARFAVVSCSNYPFGYFNVYDQIARRDDLNAVIHLGDYLYEYGDDGYGSEAGAQLGRIHSPTHEIVSLKDYRERHAQYKADPSSPAMHQAHAFIAIWDDHETTNNSWKDGAQNHQPETEGNWTARRRAALQAYYEWMPVREPAPGGMREGLFRSYGFGDLLTLTALETRLMARAQQFEYSEVVPTLKTEADIAKFRDEILWDPSREMLGRDQIDFVSASLAQGAAARQPWQLIANQIIMAEVLAPNISPYVEEEDLIELEKQWDQARAFVEFSKLGLPTNLDAWDGYPAARDRFYDLVKAANTEGLVVLTGDTHTWWANDLTDRDGAAMGVELGVSSVTSPSPYRTEFLGGKGAEYALLTNRENDTVRYVSGEAHGFIDLDVTNSEINASFQAVDSITSGDYNAFRKAAFRIAKDDRGTARFKGSKGLSFKEGWLF